MPRSPESDTESTTGFLDEGGERKDDTQHSLGHGPGRHAGNDGRLGGERHDRSRLPVLQSVRRHLRAHHAVVQGGAPRHRREVPRHLRQLRGWDQHRAARGGRGQAARRHVPGSQSPGDPRREGHRAITGTIHCQGAGLLQGRLSPSDARSRHVRRQGSRASVRGLLAGGLLHHGRLEEGGNHDVAADMGRGGRELREAARHRLQEPPCSGAGTSPGTGSSRRCCGARGHRSSRTESSTSTAPKDCRRSKR